MSRNRNSRRQRHENINTNNVIDEISEENSNSLDLDQLPDVGPKSYEKELEYEPPPEMGGTRSRLQSKRSIFFGQGGQKSFVAGVKPKVSVDLADFATAVDDLWKDAHRYSNVNPGENDTTVDFLSVHKQYLARGTPVPLIVDVGSRKAVRSRRKVVINNLKQFTKAKRGKVVDAAPAMEDSLLHRDWGFRGLSFDGIPHSDVNNRMFAVSKGIKRRDVVDDREDVSAVSNQISLNRGWKLLVVGLTQADTFARYDALVDVGRALPTLVDTLNDTVTRTDLGELLLNLCFSDERLENRIKSIYLLGQYATVLGATLECHSLLSKIFKQLAKMLLEQQLARKQSPNGDAIYGDFRLHLIRAIGKVAAIRMPGAEENESLAVYLVFQELDAIFKREEYSKPHPVPSNENDLFVMLAALDLLNSNITQTEENKVYIGALFQVFLNKMMQIQHKELQRYAIRFVSQWLPITNEEGLLIGIEHLLEALSIVKRVFGPTFESSLYLKEKNELLQRLHNEESRVSLRAKLMRTLIQAPGTVTTLYPVPGCSGFFCAINSSLRKTKSVLVDLPIHGKSNVTLTRPIPSIPGVPSATTTTPPLFLIGERWVDSRPNPKSQWEYEERCGLLPSIPPCYTSNPFGVPILSREASAEGKSRGFSVVRDPSSWSENDDIPNGTSPIPLRAEQEMDKAASSFPVGFNLTCPYPGFDPEKIDVTNAPISPIYGKSLSGNAKNVNANTAALIEKGFYQDYSCIGGSDSDKNAHMAPESATLNRHTPLYPCRLPGLKHADSDHDFPIGAPVILDIIQPHKPQLQRILCVVHGLEADACSIVVQKSLNDVGVLYQGAIFNIYIRPKSDAAAWIPVQLRIVDDDYDDGLDFTTPNQTQAVESKRRTGRKSRHSSFIPSFVEVFPHPVPVGFTASGEPYFAPPVHMAPYPSGYNVSNMPYYGKTPSVKVIPLGITLKGTRFYAGDRGKGYMADTILPKNQLAGYDCSGHPIFVPRGFTLPQPSGFTADGIPFYDIPTIIRQQGEFALPALFRSKDMVPTEADSWEELLPLIQGNKNDATHRRWEAAFLARLLDQLNESQPQVRRTMLAARTRLLNPFANKISTQSSKEFVPNGDTCVADPENISEFLRDGFAFSHLKPQVLRMNMEPIRCDFQSSRTPVTKSVALRHKAFRGDHTEREVFAAVEPPGIFSIKEFSFLLQGEGVQEISITFYPLAMKKPLVEGGLHVFDRNGKRLISSQLVAARRQFFKVSPAILDVGWILLHKRKDSFVTVENLADFQITVYMQVLQKPTSQIDPLPPSFSVETSTITLRALESVKIPIVFYPLAPGKVMETLKLSGPGGEESLVVLQGTTDMPMSIYPENFENSVYGIDILSVERTQLIRKMESLKSQESLTSVEKQILRDVSAVQSDAKARKKMHTLHFDICLPNQKTATRCLTIMNWGTNAVTCSLYPYDKLISCPRLVRVPAKSASSVEVTFSYFNLKSKGNYTSVIELACQDFDNIPIHVNAYIGHPVYFPVWENVFFTPCRLGQTATVSTVIVNDSQYDVSCYMEGLDDEHTGNTGFRMTQGYVNHKHKLYLAPFSLAPIQFQYKAINMGVAMREVSIKIVAPTFASIPGALNQKEMQLIGICLEPRQVTDSPEMNQSVDMLLQWLSQPRSLRANYEDVRQERDAGGFLVLPVNDIYDVAFKSEVYQPEVPGDFTTLPPVLAAQNRGELTRRVLFFGSPCLTVEPKSKDLLPGELVKLDLYFQPPPNVGSIVSVHGFAAVMDRVQYITHATQVVKRLSLGLMLLPFENYSEQQIVFDFGKIELSGDCNSETTRFLMLCNPFNTRSSWSIKIAPSARKTLAFEIPTLKGELGKMETFAVPFYFRTEVSGSYETKCEVFAEPTDQLARPVRLGTIILKGVASFTGLSGLPESVEFGSTIVNHNSTKKVTLTNEGTQELDVALLVRPPFEAKPKKFVIPAKAHQTIEVIFTPTEHRRVTNVLQVFANQKLFHLTVSGVGGNAQLICEQFQDRPLDFGLLEDGHIAFTEILLTNKGTIPLKMQSIMSGSPTSLRLEYLGVASTSTRFIEQKFDIRKDYWRIVRRRLKAFQFFFGDRLVSTRKFALKGAVAKTNPDRKIIEIVEIGNTATNATSLPNLAPLASYRFRIGYPVSYFDDSNREISFTYTPISDDLELTHETELLSESTTIEIVGETYLPLIINPYNLNFGYSPTESFDIIEKSKFLAELGYGVTARAASNRTGRILHLNIINKSYASQSISLEKISPEFTIQKRAWNVPGLETVEIPVEFHPPREQTKYVGSAVFAHKYGKITIPLYGIGASAEIINDETVDFGTLRLDSGGTKTLRIHNRGILASQWEMDIVQTANEFSFVDDDPYEAQGQINSGQTVFKSIYCKCRNKNGASGHVALRWKKVPTGNAELTIIPLKLQIGYPEFKLHTTALDFGATYIGINKTLKLYIHNDGNASCNWQVASDNNCITMDKAGGVLGPGETETIKVKYSPVDFEILDSSLSFTTDAGYYKLVVFGVVGIPYLKIMKDDRMIDFGLLTIGKQHHMFLDIANTGKSAIEYECEWLEMSRDNVLCRHDEFEFFFIDPAHATVASGDLFPLKLSVYPKDYGVLYEGTFIIRGNTGEEHLVKVRAIGGQAIIKINPPKVASNSSKLVSVPRNEPPITKPKKLPAPTVPPAQTTRYLVKSHVDTLYEVLGGLRAAEMDIKETMEANFDPKTLFTSKSSAPLETVQNPASRPVSNGVGRPGLEGLSKAQMEEIANIEKELEMAIAKLDPTGSISSMRFTPPSRASRGMTPLTAEKPFTPSPPPSRGYGGYQPGRRTHRSSGSVPSTPSDQLRRGSPLSTEKPSSAMSEPRKSSPLALEKPGSAIAELRKGSPLATEKPLTAIGDHSANKLPSTHEPVAPSAAKRDVRESVVAPKSGAVEKSLEKQLASRLEEEQALGRESRGAGTPEGGKSSPGGKTSTVAATAAMAASGARLSEERSIRDTVTRESKLMAIADMRENTMQVEDMISVAQSLGLSVDSGDDQANAEVLHTTLRKFLDTTKNAMKNVKDRLLAETWIPNRDLLHQALRKLQISRVAIESIIRPPEPEKEENEANFYNLDLVCGGERSALVLLFSLPNEGNIPFHYRIIPNKSDLSYPEHANIGVNEFFFIENSQGTLHPGDTINISASFFALITGSYRQGFVLKSGDDEIFSFALGAAVGNPILKYSVDSIDYGLVGKGQSVSKQLTIKNLGSFDGTWELDLEIPHHVDQNCFKISPVSGKTAISSNSLLSATFIPPGEGTFSAVVKLNWKDGPNYLALKGTGGAPKLDFSFLTPEDRTFKGLDFANCVVGVRYEKKLVVKNSGSMETVLDFSHPNNSIYFNVKRNDSGEVRLVPDESIELMVVYIPERVEKLKDPLTCILGNPKISTQTVIMKGRSGTEAMETEGVLDFLNVPLYEWQSKVVRVKNTGSFDLPLKMRWEPPNMEHKMEAEYEDWVAGANLQSGKEMSITLKSQSSAVEDINGTLFCCTVIGGKPKEFAFPFSFKCYAEEITAAITEDVSIGRVTAGEIFTKQQIITNNTNHRINFRAKIVNADGNDEVIDWTVDEDTTEGILDPNGQIGINAIFKAVAGRGDKWQNAKLIIEKSLTDTPDRWVAFSEVRLQAALGEAKFEVQPTTLNFQSLALGSSKVLTFSLQNPGSAACTYEVSPHWANESDFILEGGLTGGIRDGENVELSVRYKPSVEGPCATDITITTLVGTRTLALSGSGHELRLYKDTLPGPIEFKGILVGGSQDIDLFFDNDCPLDHELAAELIAQDGSVDPNGYISVLPTNFKLKGNDNEWERYRRRADRRNPGSVTVACGFSLVANEDGYVDKTVFDSFPFGSVQKASLLIKNQLGNVMAVIPIDFSFDILPISLFSKPSGEGEIDSSSKVSQVAFGKVPLDVGDAKSFVVYNPNNFQLKTSLAIACTTGLQFTLSVTELVIAAMSYKDFGVEFLPLDLDKFPEGPPKNVFHEGVLSITPHLSQMAALDVSVTGTLTDISAGIFSPSMVDFGTIFKQRQVTKTIPLSNNSIRPIKWSFAVEKDYADIFTVQGDTRGILAPKSSTTLTMAFAPRIGVTYNAAAYLDSGDGPVSIALTGNGVDPSLDVDSVETNFGTVGMEAPEYREIPVSNPTGLPMRIRPISDNPDFIPVDQELELAPGESAVVRVLFQPSNEVALQVANVSLYLLSDDGGVELDSPYFPNEYSTANGRPISRRKQMEILQNFKLEGKGGKFGFNVQGNDIVPFDDGAVLPNSAIEYTNIRINFGKIQTQQKMRKSFELENSGDTHLEFFIELMSGKDLKDFVTEFSEGGCLGFSVNPATCKIAPRSKLKISILLEGVRDGPDELDFLIKTRSLLKNRAVRVNVCAVVHTMSEMENIKSFLRADENIETRYTIEKQEERYSVTDLNLWKILAPIVRVAPTLPSQDRSYISPIEPNVTRPEIGPFVVRPPAIPETPVVKTKKWFNNRVAMAVDPNVPLAAGGFPRDPRRDEALEFISVSNVEKAIVLEKKRKG
ncbi:hypothetical protein HDU91_005136 [Kappamyces sp. JEL0680]|nr:hypothetical protein HDU91_005136 [Kappamyces sp. JEL0680]